MKYFEKGSAFYAPASAGVQMADSFLNDSKKELPCAAFLMENMGKRNLCRSASYYWKNGV